MTVSRNKNFLTQKNLLDIILMWNSGDHTHESIANHFNLSNQYIRQRISRANKAGLISYSPLQKVNKRNQKIIDLWNSRLHTLETIGQEIGVSRERIRQILAKLKRQGVDIESVESVSAGRHDAYVSSQINILSDASKENIIKAYHEGKSLQEIAHMVGHSETTTIRYFIRVSKQNNVLSFKQRIYGGIKMQRENPTEETLERERVLISMRSKNHSLDEIATALGISKINVTRLVKNLKLRGVYIPNSRVSGNPLSDQEISERVDIIESMLDDEKSPRSIAKFLKINDHSVNALIYEHLVDKS